MQGQVLRLFENFSFLLHKIHLRFHKSELKVKLYRECYS
jgi:hypothetical protein